MPTLNLTGKGFYAWQLLRCEGGNPDLIGRTAKAAGLSHVLIKIADGTSAYNISVDLKAIIAALRYYIPGVKILGWQYVYGYDPVSEASIAVSQVLKLGCDAYVINAEAQYKLPGRATAARTFLERLRSGLPTTPIGLSSYRYPTYHPQVPWDVFLKGFSLGKERIAGVDFVMPQVYWIAADNPAEQLVRTIKEYQALAPQTPIFPTGAAFRERGWQPKPGEVTEFLEKAEELAIPAVNFWSWDSSRNDVPELWDLVADFDYLGEPGGGVTDPPAPPPAPDPTVKRLSIRVEQPRLRVRSGPGTEYSEIGHLDVGTVLPVYDIAGANAWAKIPWQGGLAWTNVQYGNDRNCIVMEGQPAPAPVPDPEPEPEPEPPQAEPEPQPDPPNLTYRTVTVTRSPKANAFLIDGFNQAKPPRPIMVAYKTVSFAKGTDLQVYPNPLDADGPVDYWRLAPQHVPPGVPVLYVRGSDVSG